MNILIANSKSGAFYHIANGWKNAFNAGGHNALLWDGTRGSWERHRPDIYIGCASWPQDFSKLRSQTRVAIHVDPYSGETIRVPGGPLIRTRKEYVDWTIKQKPDFVFGYGFQDDMDRYWSYWRNKHGLKIVGMPNAADSTIYKETKKDQTHDCDVGWVGGYWRYKAINLDKYLMPLVNNFKVIWYGWNGPRKIWKGQANQDQVIKLFNSAKICPSVVEPHTTKFGIDVPERMFKVAACGALTILDPFKGIERFFSADSIVLAKNPTDYFRLCKQYIEMREEERKTQARKMKTEVLSKHTYFNRVQVFFRNFGYQEEASRYDELIKSQVAG